MSDENGWNEYQKLVLAELSRLSASMDTMMSQMVIIRTQLAVLKVKAGVWGMVAGAIPVIAFILMQYVVRR